MSNPKKHHYHPQWLLRRFRCADSTGSDRIHQFLVDRKPCCVSIRDAGSETGFHGPPELGIEGALSKVETSDALLIRAVEANVDLAELQDQISTTVWLLAARARAARDGFAAATSRLLGAFANELQTREGLLAFHRSSNAGFDRHLRELYPQLREQSPVPVPDYVLHAYARSQFLRFEILKHVPGLASIAADAIDSAKVAKDGHLEALTKVTGAATRMQVPSVFKSLTWRVRHFDSDVLVLGDCVGFVLTSGGMPRPLFSIAEGVTSVYVPIGPRCVLIADAPSSPPELTSSQIAACTAMSCSRVFYATRNSGVEQSLHALLGQCAGFVSDEAVYRVVQDAIAEPCEAIDPSRADEATATGVPPDPREYQLLRRLGCAVLNEAIQVSPSDQSNSEVLHLLLQSASLLASGYLVAMGLPASVSRARFDVRRILPVDITREDGSKVLGVGGLVGPTRGPARFTILVMPNASPAVLWNNDMNWWRTNS